MSPKYRINKRTERYHISKAAKKRKRKARKNLKAMYR